RLVEEGFGESIPAVVIHVYSMGLTVPGEVSLRGATHLEQLPKTLTSLVSHQVQGILTGHGIPKYRPISVRRERQLFDPESSHLKKILLNFGYAHATGRTPSHCANDANALQSIPAERRGEGPAGAQSVLSISALQRSPPAYRSVEHDHHAFSARRYVPQSPRVNLDQPVAIASRQTESTWQRRRDIRVGANAPEKAHLDLC
ncbi:hypothetical protein, partial [Paraburkholderia agricolaris]|uniref:hypothetical protein n=1 Tax=Paraburkholderia agricolaris TaxID=2152888 RepID=UPI001C2C912D